MNDPHNLQRFVDAQSSVYEEVCAELRTGYKTSHWIWFIFPQFEGLGFSSTARHFAIQSLSEAQAYLAHELLGPRLRECTQLVIAVYGRSSRQIFGEIDSLKFRSCMTLFANAAKDDVLFQSALDKYYEGQPDRLTLERLTLP